MWRKASGRPGRKASRICTSFSELDKQVKESVNGGVQHRPVTRWPGVGRHPLFRCDVLLHGPQLLLEAGEVGGRARHLPRRAAVPGRTVTTTASVAGAEKHGVVHVPGSAVDGDGPGRACLPDRGDALKCRTGPLSLRHSGRGVSASEAGAPPGGGWMRHGPLATGRTSHPLCREPAVPRTCERQWGHVRDLCLFGTWLVRSALTEC